jgi:hypothetical protein
MGEKAVSELILVVSARSERQPDLVAAAERLAELVGNTRIRVLPLHAPTASAPGLLPQRAVADA